jgi:hypothetical protein
MRESSVHSFGIGVAPALAVLAVACARREVAAADCRAPASDSARAACVALDTVVRSSGVRSRALSAARAADGGFRVRTVPAEANVLDGMAVVEVDRAGRVRSVTLGDSL